MGNAGSESALRREEWKSMRQAGLSERQARRSEVAARQAVRKGHVHRARAHLTMHARHTEQAARMHSLSSQLALTAGAVAEEGLRKETDKALKTLTNATRRQAKRMKPAKVKKQLDKYRQACSDMEESTRAIDQAYQEQGTTAGSALVEEKLSQMMDAEAMNLDSKMPDLVGVAPAPSVDSEIEELERRLGNLNT